MEGESDAQTLWFQGLPALGIPGAASWKEDRDAPQFIEVCSDAKKLRQARALWTAAKGEARSWRQQPGDAPGPRTATPSMLGVHRYNVVFSRDPNYGRG